MTEIDQAFSSFASWQAWAAANPYVYDSSAANEIGKRILAAGFAEPLTRAIIPATEIQHEGGNWREGLLARGLNARMRAVLALIDEGFGTFPAHDVRIFATEAVTAFALLLRGRFARFLGSEYGVDDAARSRLFPIPHQDLTALTLPSDSFHLVTTNEVLEHVPDLDAALREIARVLVPGGWHIGTHPFMFTKTASDLRSVLVDGKVSHLKEPEYHGNPVDAGGSLVFETPAWDIIDRARAAGFSNPHMRFVCSERRGFLTENTGVFVFCAQK